MYIDDLFNLFKLYFLWDISKFIITNVMYRASRRKGV